MANVGTGASGKTLIGSGIGSSPTYATIGTNSGLSDNGVVLGGGNDAFSVAPTAHSGYVLTSNGLLSSPSFQQIPLDYSLAFLLGGM